MATKLDAIKLGYRLATGKTTLPAIGTAKRDLLTSFAEDFYRDWQTEPGVEWDILSADVSAGVVTAGNDTFDLAESVHFISKDENNHVVISDTQYTVVSLRQLSKYKTGRAVAHVVEDGVHKVKFSKPFTEDDALIGEEILVPCVTKLDDLTTDESVNLIPIPQWLGKRIGAQYAYSFKSLRDQYDDLLALANEDMTSMKSANSPGNESYNTGIDYFAMYGSVGTDL